MSLGLKGSRVALIIIGSLCASLALRLFLVPAGLLSGGVAGFALIIYYIEHVPISLSLLVLNIPIFILGLKQLRQYYMIRSFIGLASYTFFIALWQQVLPVEKPLVDDLLLNALFGGVIGGIGFGLIFRGRGTAGGTDILAIIFNRLYSISIGSFSFVFNALPLAIGALIFDIRLVGYTLISMYISSYMVDRVQVGIIRSKTVMIVSDKHEEMAAQILERVRRGVTLLQGEGAFTHGPKKVILTTVSLTQLTKLKDVVAEVDPSAFMTVTDASDVLGKGFGKVREDES